MFWEGYSMQWLCVKEHIFFHKVLLGTNVQRKTIGKCRAKELIAINKWFQIALFHPLSKADKINPLLLIIPTKVMGLILINITSYIPVPQHLLWPGIKRICLLDGLGYMSIPNVSTSGKMGKCSGVSGSHMDWMKNHWILSGYNAYLIWLSGLKN